MKNTKNTKAAKALNVTIHDLAALAAASRRVLSRHYIDSTVCIAATRHGLALLHAMGMKARPLLTEVEAHCPTGSVAVLHDSAGLGLAGHLVIQVEMAGEHYILDLSAFQFDRPQHGLDVPEGVLTPVRRGRIPTHSPIPVLAGREFLAIDRTGRTTTILYFPHPQPALARWESAPDWVASSSEKKRRHEMVVRDLQSVLVAARTVQPVS